MKSYQKHVSQKKALFLNNQQLFVGICCSVIAPLVGSCPWILSLSYSGLLQRVYQDVLSNRKRCHLLKFPLGGSDVLPCVHAGKI